MSTVCFDHYFTPVKKDLYSFAVNLTKSPFEADDLIQETSLKVFRNLEKFDKSSNFKSWAMTILKNTFLTNIKYTKVYRTRLENYKYLHDDFVQQNEMDSEDQDRSSLLWDKINQLPKKSREPFIMYVNGNSYIDIAEVLDIPIGTVKSRINYARTILKKRITSRRA